MSEPIPEKGHACIPTKFNFKNQPITKLLPSFAREFFKSANFQLKLCVVIIASAVFVAVWC